VPGVDRHGGEPPDPIGVEVEQNPARMPTGLRPRSTVTGLTDVADH